MKAWMWIAVAVGVLWYMTEREKASLKIAGNKAATNATDAAGRGVVKVIDETASAVGKWVAGWFSHEDKPSNSGSSTGSSAASSPDFWDDQFGAGQDYGTGE